MTKNRFLQHVQKTEHINWAWFGIPHAAQRKLFPKCNFFSQESTKSYRRITFFYQKVRDLHFLCHLIWPRWFNFIVHDLSVYIWLDFVSVFHMIFVYSRKKTNDKKVKKIKKPYLPTSPIFLEYVTPSAVPRRIFILLNQY